MEFNFIIHHHFVDFIEFENIEIDSENNNYQYIDLIMSEEDKDLKCWSCENEAVRLYNQVLDKFDDIDENIFQLVREIWKANIHLMHICGHNCRSHFDYEFDCIWFSFGSGDDYEKFINCITI